MIIPESVPLSDSEDDIRFIARRVRLVSYGDSTSPAASIIFQQASAVLAPTNENVPTPSSSEKPGPLRTTAALSRFGTQVRFKLNTKANRITATRPYDPKNIDDDVPDRITATRPYGPKNVHDDVPDLRARHGPRVLIFR